MQEFCGFFNGVFIGHDEEGYEKYDREYDANDLSEVLGAFFKDGVFPKPSTGLFVQAAEDYQVKVNEGQAFVNKKFYRIKGGAKLLRLEDPDINFNRIDRVVLRCDEDKRMIELDVLTGVPSSKPNAKELTRNNLIHEICFAEVTVRSKASSINSTDIKDTRFNENLCGIVATALDELDVEDIRNKYDESVDELIQLFKEFLDKEESHILELINKLNNILESENAVGEIISMINKKQDRVIKDTKNENEYIVEITEGRPFLKVVK